MLTRKAFLARLAGGGWTLLLAGCGGGDGYSAPPPAGSGCRATLITGNHGHTLAIPTADLNSSVAMTYSIQGTADHSHNVTFSPAQLATLKAGGTVTVTTTTTIAHNHDLTEGCA